MKIYSSSISYKLIYIIITIFYSPLIFEIIKYQVITKIFVSIFIFISIIVFLILQILINTKYIIKNNNLIIMCISFKYTMIDINSIIEVKKTKSIISSPASSFDRIKISYNKYDSMVISPKNKKEFINHLLNINPKIITKYL